MKPEDNCEQAILQLTDRKQLLLDQVERIDNCIDTLRQVLGSGKEPAETKTPARPVEPKPPVIKSRKSPKSTSKKKASNRKTSQYKGVERLKPNKSGQVKYKASYWDGKNKKNIYLGTHDSDLLAAAAYQDNIGNEAGARDLRALAKQQKSDMAEQAENNQDRPKDQKKMKKWRCKHCGLEVRHPKRPSIGCIRCNNSSYEQI